jgi:hypothetical protein
MSRSINNLAGRRFGHLVAEVLIQRNPTKWECLCDCGRRVSVFASALTTKNTRSCGCAYKARTTMRLRPFEALYNKLKRQKHFSDLSYEEFLSLTKEKECHYCGESVVWNPYTRHGSSIATNVDRKDSRIGYTKGNVVTCCTRCNRAKLDHFTYDEWMEIGAVIRKMNARNRLAKVA